MDLADSPDAPDLADADVKHLAVEKIPVDLLVAADSPRLSGENLSHARLLADSEERLPPILVHRPTMRVVDGTHRLRAVKLRGQKEIGVRYVDGDEATAFVLAVRANIMHGLPLALAERRAAAARIISLYPHWPDRAIATTAGLAAKTVAALRELLTGENHAVGHPCWPGRARPAGQRRSTPGHRRPACIGKPRCVTAEVAHKAGVSPETVRNVRARIFTAASNPILTR